MRLFPCSKIVHAPALHAQGSGRQLSMPKVPCAPPRAGEVKGLPNRSARKQGRPAPTAPRSAASQWATHLCVLSWG